MLAASVSMPAAGRRQRAFVLYAVLLSAALPFFSGDAKAADEQPWMIRDALRYEGQRITDISFRDAAGGAAELSVSAAELLAMLPFHTGSQFHEADLRAAIQRLYATGHFLQIAVDAEDQAAGVALRFLTSQAYFVGHVSITGIYVPPNRGQLFGAAKLRLGAAYNELETRQAVDSMQDLLRQNGFYKSQVVPHVTYNPRTSQASILFELRTGKRARFTQPEIVGNGTVPPDEIVRVSHWKRLYGLLGWQQVTEARVLSGLNNIRNYYDKQEFLQARISLQRDYSAETDRVKPVIHIDAGSRIAVHVSGAKISRGDLKTLVPVFQERAIDVDLLNEGDQNIEEYLQSQGYFGAETAHSVEKKGEQTTITYTIQRGQRHRFVYLGIAGNRYFKTDTLRERMFEAPAQFPRYPNGRFSLTYLQDDVDAIERLYAANGFSQAKVSSRVVDDLDGVKGHVGVYLTIDEGQQVIISSLSIEGLPPIELLTVQQMLASVQGQPFSAANVSVDRENILTYYYDRGYLSASFEYAVDPAAEADRVNLKYIVTRGPQRYVRDVIVSGLQTTRRELVLRRIELTKGEPISLAKETDSQRRLYNLGVFARVNTALQDPEGDETYKDVLYDIDEARHYSLNVGVGAQIARIGGSVTTLDNPAGTTGFAPRLAVGLTRENFLGLGQSLGLQTAVSTIEQRAALTWFVPQFVSNPNLNLTAVLLADNSNDVRTFSAHRREASLQLGQRISRAYTLQYRLVFRNVTLANLKIDQLLVPLLSQPETVGLTEVSLIEDQRDDPTNAHHGSYNTVDLSYAPAFLGSQIQFGRAQFRNSTYHSLKREFVLARSTQFGIIERTGGRSNVPLAERLYSGGSTSIRAFPDFQAGPRDLVTGFPLGGNALFINNTELRFPLYGDNLGAVLFHDAGNVYSTIGDFSFRFRQDNLQDFNYMVQDVGLGIRYRTPIGPIRADFSFSPDAPRFFGLKGTLQDYLNGTAASMVQKINAFQFHISLGQAF